MGAIISNITLNDMPHRLNYCVVSILSRIEKCDCSPQKNNVKYHVLGTHDLKHRLFIKIHNNLNISAFTV